jgi:hypothetical protein
MSPKAVLMALLLVGCAARDEARAKPPPAPPPLPPAIVVDAGRASASQASAASDAGAPQASAAQPRPKSLRDQQCERARARLAHAGHTPVILAVRVDPGQTIEQARQRVINLLPPDERPANGHDNPYVGVVISARGLDAVCASPWVLRVDRNSIGRGT